MLERCISGVFFNGEKYKANQGCVTLPPLKEIVYDH